MKKIFAMFLAALMIVSLVACGDKKSTQNETSKETPSQFIAPEKDYDENDPTAVLGEITTDFAAVTTRLTGKLTETFATVGSTYEDYQKNKGLVDEWITLVLSESDALFARTKENSIAYFKLIATDEDHEYSEFCDEALDEYYDTVYDKAMDEYYDTLYDDAMDDLYDEYYDGIMDDAYDDVKYEEWSNASSECYKQWSDASSAIYKKWSDASSYVYGLWSAMNSAFCWNDNFDVDAIVAEYEKEKAAEDAEKSEEETKEYIEFDVEYEINEKGDAEVVGYSGEGNQITISSEYEGHDVVRIADSAFEGCTNLEKLIIWGDPDIGEYAFADCVSLTEISIGSDTKNIGAHAFEGCTGVTSLIIWGVEIIGDYAFAGCTGIEDVSIPSDVLSIGNHAFDGCTALSSVIVWDDETAIGKEAFANCPNLDDVPSARGTVLECTMSKSESSESDNKTKLNEHAQNKDTETTTDGMRPEFKEAMDSYETFYDEYCDFMKKYSENSSDLTLLAEYMDMLEQVEEMDEKFDEWENKDLNDAELKYYLEVSNRVMQKLVDVI